MCLQITLLTERFIRHITEKQMLLTMELMFIQITLENKKEKKLITFNIKKTEFESKVQMTETLQLSNKSHYLV
jgi:hypothetical protein